MTSEQPDEAYVWVWLPGKTRPVVAGRVAQAADLLTFNYGRSYLAREDAIPLYLPELPLRPGAIRPLSGLTIPGCIADAMPDAWGQRVIMHHLAGAAALDPGGLGPMTYLLASGSDRIGGLDFQASADVYVDRGDGRASLADLMRAAAMVDEGLPLPAALDRALLHGSSVGGARPKALLEDDGRSLIAKFGSSTDPHPVVRGEYVAMELARRSGLDVAPVELAEVLGRDVLLVERFDRGPAVGERRPVVSALTILALDEMGARYASYADLAEAIRERFVDAPATLRELFTRIAFNVIVGNNDDHARNHAAFWDGEALELTPAYDICPQVRGGGETAQAMAIGKDGFRMSQLAGCVAAASTYLLSAAEAREIVDHQIDVVRSQWQEVCDAARLGAAERDYFWGRQFLNRYALDGY